MLDNMVQTPRPARLGCENARSKSLRKYPAAAQHRITPEPPHHNHEVDPPPRQWQVRYMPPIPALDTTGHCPTAGAGASTSRRTDTDRHTVSINGGVLDDKPFRNKIGWAKSLIHGADSFPNHPTASSICSKCESEPKIDPLFEVIGTAPGGDARSRLA